jgi:hypothetical protein
MAMGVTVGVNMMSVVHAKSSGITIAFPDVCKTPAPPAPPLPIPYPNIAKSGDTAKGTKKVKCDGESVCVKDSNFSTSTGDEAGSLGGIVSSKTKGKAEFVNFSFDVKFEGKNVARAFDLMAGAEAGVRHVRKGILKQRPSPLCTCTAASRAARTSGQALERREEILDGVTGPGQTRDPWAAGQLAAHLHAQKLGDFDERQALEGEITARPVHDVTLVHSR